MEVASRFGFDLSKHIARQASAAMLTAADLVLVMERDHADWAHSRAPHLRGRIQALGRWRDLEIPDPYQRPREAFERAFEQIDDCIADWLPRLLG